MTPPLSIELATYETRKRLRKVLAIAPTGGLSRGEIALLLLDVHDDLVSQVLCDEIQDGGVVVTGNPPGIVRYRLLERQGV
jgi:hypothetical protein